jgi:hypothetical protein
MEPCAQSSDLKLCFKCKVSKPRTAFYPHPNMGDGLLGKCKDCTRADTQAYYRDHKPERQAYDKRRGQTSARKAAATHAARLTRARHAHRYAARTAVANALRDGRLMRKPCEVCGSRAEAHHPNYYEPLSVVWLCLEHHRAWHTANATIG